MGSSFLDYVVDQLPPGVRPKAMFGGTGLYLDGVFFAVAYDERLYFKVDAATVERHTAAGMGPFTPPRGPVVTSYYEVPADVIDDRETLAAWAADAVDVARASR